MGFMDLPRADQEAAEKAAHQAANSVCNEAVALALQLALPDVGPERLELLAEAYRWTASTAAINSLVVMAAAHRQALATLKPIIAG